MLELSRISFTEYCPANHHISGKPAIYGFLGEGNFDNTQTLIVSGAAARHQYGPIERKLSRNIAQTAITRVFLCNTKPNTLDNKRETPQQISRFLHRPNDHSPQFGHIG